MKSIILTKWSDIPRLSLNAYLNDLSKGTSMKVCRVNLIRSIVSFHCKISLEDAFLMYDELDLSFLDKPPTYPLISEYRRGFKTLLFGKEKLLEATGLEFRLIDEYYNIFLKKGDHNDLLRLTATILRPKSEAKELLLYDDRRKQIKSRQEIEIRSKKLRRIPPYIFIAILYYAQANLDYISKTYGPIIGGDKSEDETKLGWQGTFMSISENPAFGDLEKVDRTNIHTLLIFLIKKKQDNDAIEKAQNKSII